MKNIVDEHAPVKTMQVRDHDVPYMTTKWKNAIRAKRKTEAKYRKNKTAANYEHKRIYRNEATKQRRLAIKEYWRTKSEDLRRNPRDFFKTFKPFLSDKGARSDPDIELNIGGDIVKDQIKVTEILADHFAIGGTDAELLNLKDFNDHPSVQLIEEKSRGCEVFDFQEVNPTQVKSVLESLDVNKATGHDGISARILKAGAEEISLPLSLYNSCIRKDQWPCDWKKGDWTPVYKKDDRHAKENYRPITVLSCANKVFERLLGNQITTKYDDRLVDGLTAYRKHNSCETSLIGLVEDWKFDRDSRLSEGILSTDMSKAFDSLHPPLMLCKLKAYGFQDRALDLLHSYLCSRLGRVRIGSVTSSWRNVERGCPQGSVLGPLLWNIFQNDLSYNIDSGLSMYADDHQIYVKGKDMCTIVAKLQESATLATNWYDSNLLQGNLKKYQTMNIRNKSVNYGDKTSITVNGKDIMESDNLEFLGVTIDCGLNFNLHISNVCKKASQRIVVIMRLRNLIPTEAKLHLFKAAILPHLTYCDLVWHFCRVSDTRRLERVQERGLTTNSC